MEKNMKISFVFYRSWVDAIAPLDGETTKVVLLDIARYALDGTEPDFKEGNDTSSMLRQAIFGMARGLLDNDREKYKETCERNRKIAQEREARRKQGRDTTRNGSSPLVTDTDTGTEIETESGTETESETETGTDPDTGSGADSERGSERGAGGTGGNSRTYKRKPKDWASMSIEEQNAYLIWK